MGHPPERIHTGAHMRILSILALVLVVAASSASADTGPWTHILDSFGFDYRVPAPGNTPDLPPGFLEIGDGYESVGFVSWGACLAPPYDPATSEYTIRVSAPAVISIATFEGFYQYDFAEGRISIYRDRDPASGGVHGVPGVDPPNATMPDTYTDADGSGILILGGTMHLILDYNSNNNSGFWDAEFVWDEGPMLRSIAPNFLKGWQMRGGIFTTYMPQGFFAQSQGYMRVNLDCAPVPVRISTWGSLKSLYR
jgi:hypothetical protein